MVHSFALCISSDDKRVVDSSLTICSFSADVQDMLISMPFVPRVESGRGVPRRNKVWFIVFFYQHASEL